MPSQLWKGMKRAYLGQIAPVAVFTAREGARGVNSRVFGRAVLATLPIGLPRPIFLRLATGIGPTVKSHRLFPPSLREPLFFPFLLHFYKYTHFSLHYPVRLIHLLLCDLKLPKKNYSFICTREIDNYWKLIVFRKIYYFFKAVKTVLLV